MPYINQTQQALEYICEAEFHVLSLSRKQVIMKAISPVLPMRRTHVNSHAQDLGIWRSKNAWDEPLGVLCDMNDCYSRLKELVPSLPQDRSVSKMEILQHVIDYILDLQIALDSSGPQPQRQPGQAGVSSSSEADISSFQVGHPRQHSVKLTYTCVFKEVQQHANNVYRYAFI